jgi:hypothetical protein
MRSIRTRQHPERARIKLGEDAGSDAYGIST